MLLVRSKFIVLSIASVIFCLASSIGNAQEAKQEKLTNASCLECHADNEPVINEKVFNQSAHKDASCVDCHSDIKELPHADQLAKVNCSSCHEDVAKQFEKSVHFQLAQKKVTDLPSCADCHGTHNIFPKDDPRSMVNHFKSDGRCLSCHANKDILKKHKALPSADFVNKYLNSVHGQGVHLKGLTVSATCSDCHGGHAILPASDPQSTVFKKNVPNTCRKCHEGIYNDYVTSIHGQLWLAGNTEVPVCTTCHAEHGVGDPLTKASQRAIPQECGHCHQGRIATYADTFHGKATSLGSGTAAKCSDCHTAHKILPASDPASSINKAQLLTTCMKCHENINAKFVQYDPHINPHDKTHSFSVYLTYQFMKFLLISVFLFWGIHTLLWFQRAVVALIRREFTLDPHQDKYVRRFSNLQRRLHGIVIVSFLGLVMTGLPLKYNYTHWAQSLCAFLGGIDTCRYYHRIFGLLTLGYFVFHLGYLTYKVLFKKEKDLVYGPHSMMPRAKDIEDFQDNLKWFFYKGDRPKYDRWTYFEKFDYFAVFWGVGVIGLSGLVMWFPAFFTQFCSGTILNIAAIIHSDEALLALAFIFTVHFFHNHLRVENFPIDLSIFSGVIPLERFIKERPQEYRRLLVEGKLDTVIVPPPSKKTVIKSLIFGLTALALGFALIIAIFITYLFQSHPM